MARLDDTQVIEEVLAGKTDAFRFLIERYQTMVFRFVGNLVPDYHQREDVAQEVFLVAFANLASYDSSRATFSTWLCTIARNKCLNLMKSKRRGVERAHCDVARVGGDAAPNYAVEDELRVQLDEALHHLPPEQRTAFVLAEIEECSYEQIAQIEQTPIGTIKSRINRARQRLRARLKRTVEPQ